MAKRDKKSALSEMTAKIRKFRDARNWKQFHKPKDMAISLLLEASEFVEHFQWQSDEQIKLKLSKKRTELGRELSDVLYWVLLLAHDLGINLEDAFNKKMVLNAKKYPVAKAKGRSEKYTKLRKNI